MTSQKISIGWEQLKTRQVEQRLRQQEAVERNRQYARITAPPEEDVKPRGSIWYNVVFAASVFGLVGGLLAWMCVEGLHFVPSARMEATQLMGIVHDINVAASVGRLSEAEAQTALGEVARAGAQNPYFVIYSNASLSQAEKETRFAQVQSREAWKEFFANVMRYGVAGMVIAVCLAIAEPVVDRNIGGVIVNGSVGATLGLFGGVMVALFV